MTTERNRTNGDPAPEATEGLLRLLFESRGRRISSARFDGRTVWIKRFDVHRVALPKRLHGLISPLLPLPFLRASVPADPQGFVEREVRKMAAFRAAGFLSPEVLFQGETALVVSEVAPDADRELKRLRKAGEAVPHDKLLEEVAAALGRAHARGLCHGRPHPRDMFLHEGRWGFFDFEEEPEAAMPLAAAQARDVWLLFMQIAGRALREDTAMRAFARYRAEAPADVVPALRPQVRFFSFFVPVLAMLRPIGLGKDGRRLLDGTRFLRSALSVPERADADAPAASPRTNTGRHT